MQSKEERMMIIIGEVIQELLKAHHENQDIDLNKLKTRISAKYGLDSSPKLVDIIAAVPNDVKHILVPKLKAKPIRTASGVSLISIITY
jgi:elongator complex protein 3